MMRYEREEGFERRQTNWLSRQVALESLVSEKDQLGYFESESWLDAHGHSVDIRIVHKPYQPK